MNDLGFFIPLVKIDVERRLIIGRAAQEIPDRTKEIMDYPSGKIAFQEWSKSFDDATGGLSKGNVRVMHTKVAAGKVVELNFNDADKAVDVMVKVVDDQEWKKCIEGVYTGFSMGGGYAKSWQDGDLKRYTPRISELSLVDMPCIPTAKFAELVKADGMVEQLELKGRPLVKSYAELRKSATPTYADLRASEPQTYGELRKGLSDRDYMRAPKPNLGGRSYGGAVGRAAIGAIAVGAGAAVIGHLARKLNTGKKKQPAFPGMKRGSF